MIQIEFLLDWNIITPLVISISLSTIEFVKQKCFPAGCFDTNMENSSSSSMLYVFENPQGLPFTHQLKENISNSDYLSNRKPLALRCRCEYQNILKLAWKYQEDMWLHLLWSDIILSSAWPQQHYSTFNSISMDIFVCIAVSVCDWRLEPFKGQNTLVMFFQPLKPICFHSSTFAIDVFWSLLPEFFLASPLVTMFLFIFTLTHVWSEKHWPHLDLDRILKTELELRVISGDIFSKYTPLRGRMLCVYPFRQLQLILEVPGGSDRQIQCRQTCCHSFHIFFLKLIFNQTDGHSHDKQMKWVIGSVVGSQQRLIKASKPRKLHKEDDSLM